MTSKTQAADLEVVVVGAGVAGLTIAYGLRDVLGIKLRVFERRTGESTESLYNTTRSGLTYLRGGMLERLISYPSIEGEANLTCDIGRPLMLNH
jgi:cation diffusion facilitator CzcD-associated flavoprotein CzcO